MQKGKPSTPLIPDQMDVEALVDHARVKQREDVRMVFNTGELEEMKAAYFQVNSRLDARVQLAAAVKACVETDEDPLEALRVVLEECEPDKLGELSVKTLKAQSKELMEKINRGSDVVEMLLFGHDFQDVSRMAFYDEYGLFHYDRPLTEQEKQTSIVTQIRATA